MVTPTQPHQDDEKPRETRALPPVKQVSVTVSVGCATCGAEMEGFTGMDTRRGWMFWDWLRDPASHRPGCDRPRAAVRAIKPEFVTINAEAAK